MPNLRKKSGSITESIYKEVGGFFKAEFGDHCGWAHSLLFAAGRTAQYLLSLSFSLLSPLILPLPRIICIQKGYLTKQEKNTREQGWRKQKEEQEEEEETCCSIREEKEGKEGLTLLFSSHCFHLLACHSCKMAILNSNSWLG